MLPILFINIISIANVVQMFSDSDMKSEASSTEVSKVNVWNATLVDVLTSLKEPERYTLIDVRRRDAYDKGHIPGAVSVPWQEVESSAEEKLLDGLKPKQIVIVYCADTACSSAFLSAGKIADKLGVVNIGVYGGGLNEWSKCGLSLSHL